MIRRAGANAELQAEVKNQRLQIDIPDELILADADGGKLEQALENILSNAIKYTPNDGTIALSLEADELRARFTVSDTGAGIEPALIPTLFAKYHRLNGTAKRATGGTGLGLLIAKEIVQAHGGHIRVHSPGEPGKGSTFVIDIPRSTPLSRIDSEALMSAVDY